MYIRINDEYSIKVDNIDWSFKLTGNDGNIYLGIDKNIVCSELFINPYGYKMLPVKESAKYLYEFITDWISDIKESNKLEYNDDLKTAIKESILQMLKYIKEWRCK